MLICGGRAKNLDWFKMQQLIFLMALTFALNANQTQAQTATFDQTLYDQEAAACKASECDPAWYQQSRACTQGHITAADRERVVACSSQAMKESMICYNSCLDRAKKKASKVR
jgi:hypothetical protein